MKDEFKLYDENRKIQQIIPADDWWVLIDWPDYEEYQEEPVIAFALIDELSDDDYECVIYQRIIPVLQDWAMVEGGYYGRPYDTKMDRDELGKVIEMYRGKGNNKYSKQRRKTTNDKRSIHADP